MDQEETLQVPRWGTPSSSPGRASRGGRSHTQFQDTSQNHGCAFPRRTGRLRRHRPTGTGTAVRLCHREEETLPEGNRAACGSGLGVGVFSGAAGKGGALWEITSNADAASSPVSPHSWTPRTPAEQKVSKFPHALPAGDDGGRAPSAAGENPGTKEVGARGGPERRGVPGAAGRSAPGEASVMARDGTPENLVLKL